jgi:hypothetical protein
MFGSHARYVRDDGRHVIESFEDEDGSVVVPPTFARHGALPRVGDVG